MDGSTCLVPFAVSLLDIYVIFVDAVAQPCMVLCWLFGVAKAALAKKKPEAEKLVEARAQVNDFLQQHDRVPVWDDAVGEGRALYHKLRKAKLLHVLNEAKDRRVLEAVSNFLVEEGRLPKRGLQRERENNLAQQWERLLREREKLPRDLQEDFAALFSAVEDGSVAGQGAVCVAVEFFFRAVGVYHAGKWEILPSREKKICWHAVGTNYSSKRSKSQCENASAVCSVLRRMIV